MDRNCRSVSWRLDLEWNQRMVNVSDSAAPAAALLFGGSLRFGGLQASHLEIGDQLVGNLSQDRLGQGCLGSLKEKKSPNDISSI